ncbi:MAG: NitT/TauT family transport system substrate-binding protein, partial [Parasphingorhabdus sp.]
MADIHIQFTLFSAFYTPLIVTMSGGFLRDESIDYEWSVAPPGVSAIAAIEAGTAQVIQSAPSQGLTALQAGKKPSVLHFAQVNEMDGFFITAREPDNDFDWKKLEGSEVVLFAGGQPNIMFRYACHIAGIDYTKIKQITPGGAQPIDKAFRDGQGQYVVQQGPFPQQLEEEKLGSVV